MSQFATMIPLSGLSPNIKTSNAASAEGAPSGQIGEGEGLDFAQTLQDMSASNPYAAALLLALQHAGVLAEDAPTLQTGGTLLPSATETGGNPLPLGGVRSLQLESLQALQDDSSSALQPLQLQRLLGEGPVASRQQVFAKLVESGLAGEGFRNLETQGLGEGQIPLQGLGALQHSSPVTGAQRPMIALPLQVPVGQQGWDNALGERIQWMLNRHVQQAEIKLSPPDLGPMEIKISLQNDQTSVHFLANHGTTRDALEAAIPRLRELFGEINLNLANVDVSQHQAGNSGTGQQGMTEATEELVSDPGFHAAQDGAAGGLRLQSQGLLDTYV